MVRAAKRVIVESGTDLLRILEEVKGDRQTRIIEKEGKTVAAVVDIGDLDRVLTTTPTAEDIKAALAVAGSWSDVDAESLKRSIYGGRRTGNRPASRPA
jgi:hypothetical protein